MRVLCHAVIQPQHACGYGHWVFRRAVAKSKTGDKDKIALPERFCYAVIGDVYILFPVFPVGVHFRAAGGGQIFEVSHKAVSVPHYAEIPAASEQHVCHKHLHKLIRRGGAVGQHIQQLIQGMIPCLLFALPGIFVHVQGQRRHGLAYQVNTPEYRRDLQRPLCAYGVTLPCKVHLPCAII